MEMSLGRIIMAGCINKGNTMNTLDFSKYRRIGTGTIGLLLIIGVLYTLPTPSNDRQWTLDQEKFPSSN